MLVEASQAAYKLTVAPGTNEPPDSVISQTDERLTCLDEKRSIFEGKLEQFEEDRELLSNYRMRNKAILSPLRRVPPELLCEIFSWTSEFSTSAAMPWGKFDMIFPRWRAIALSSPSLWSLVALDYESPLLPPLSPNIFPFVEARIRRSQKLRIHFYGSRKRDSGPQIQMLELLSRHASQWEELSIGITCEMTPLLATLRDQLASLKRLWIQWDGPESQTVESINCFRTASSLVDVGIYNEYRFLPITHPVKQLTRYQLDAPWETHKGILKLAPELVEARIAISFDWDPWSDSEEIVHCSLQRLYVSNHNALKFLRLPVLEGLAVRLLESFLKRSGCSLRRLCLRWFPDAYITTEVLQKFPPSPSSGPGQINGLMEALTVSENRAMLLSRWKSADCALASAALLIDSGPRPSRATRRGLHALRLEGLDFVLAKGPQAGNDIQVWGYAASWN
ncbi:hypothetical protein K438DRAFT_1808742 [Mycena galopus ATCC 62051]|nr:hypothetical protein K438DRAFT_1808742 [Mycena galopus ATCC 62051]